jgi:ADP-heptose:LPS heptosyltransferase
LKKFLVIQTAFLGDVVLATAVVEKLHRFFPDASIDFMLRKGNESLLANHPIIKKVLVWNKKNNKYNNLLNLLRKEQYDQVINLQRFAASGFITAYSGAKEKIGFDKNPFSFLFDKKFKHVIGTKANAGEHEVARCLHLIDHITDLSFERPKLYPATQDYVKVQPYVTSEYFTISPASVWFTKQAPPQVWTDLINRDPQKTYYLLGAPADKELCNTIAKQCPNAQVVVLAGTLTLLQSAALMQQAKMNYTNDSAPLHLCSATNAPVTAVFCSTIPEFGFGPLSDNSTIAETLLELDCRPCGLHGYSACPKGHFKCSHIKLPTID